jgi:hypothetical protein
MLPAALRRLVRITSRVAATGLHAFANRQLLVTIQAAKILTMILQRSICTAGFATRVQAAPDWTPERNQLRVLAV